MDARALPMTSDESLRVFLQTLTRVRSSCACVVGQDGSQEKARTSHPHWS